MSNEKKMFRVLAQSEHITVTMFPKMVTTYDETEAQAKKYIPPGTNPFVIQEICDQDDWESGELNFCPRCGSKAYFDGYGRFECDECNVIGEANVELFERVGDEE